jgi:hypothetical protein
MNYGMLAAMGNAAANAGNFNPAATENAAAKLNQRKIG